MRQRHGWPGPYCKAAFMQYCSPKAPVEVPRFPRVRQRQLLPLMVVKTAL
jgi:hypothetical protein